MALFKPATRRLPLVKKHYRTTGTTVALSCESGSDTRVTGIATGDPNPFDHQPQSFGDFAHGVYSRLQPAVHQVNLLLRLLLQEQGDIMILTSTGDEVPYTARDSSFARKLEEAQLVPPFHTYYYNYPHRRNRKDRRQACYHSLLQTTMEPLPHGLWSCLPASH